MIDKQAVHIRDYRARLAVVSDYISDGDRVLDYGCYHGTLGFLGHNTFMGKSVIVDGFDKPDNHAAHYHEFKQVSKTYDLILAIRVFEHVEDTEIMPILTELRRFAPRLIIDVPNTQNLMINIKNNPDHKGPRDNQAMLSMIEASGWHVMKIIKNEWKEQGCGLLPSTLRFLVNLALARSPFWGYMIICE